MEILSILLSASSLVLLIMVYTKSQQNDQSVKVIEGVRSLMQEELKSNRQELNLSLKENREELSNGLDKLTNKLENKLQHIEKGIHKNAKEDRQELANSLKNFGELFSKNVKEFNELQKQKFELMTKKQDELVKSTELKLEKMRETVDEKLHKTLEDRLGKSFKIVSDRLEAVQKGLGEMQSLAHGVGDLKKVLSNVKTRGILGEIQLANILEQIMATEQYEANVKTKQGSNDLVEFAIKLPGKDDNGKEVYLPIDAKFPQEDYIRLQDAYEAGDSKAVEQATKSLVISIKKFAKDISDKYIDPPHTTDFGIMFLPIEGLYAEVVRQADLVAYLQREHKIIITGPTTLAAMLNSLQMGFKTLAIQKRSSEVWQVLGAVKKQFGEFGKVLKKAQEKIRQADGEIEKLVTTRTNMMYAKLKKVEELPAQEANKLLEVDTSDEQ